METGMLLESVFKNSNKNTVYINKKDPENNLLVSWPITPHGLRKGVVIVLRVVYYWKIYDKSNAAGGPQMEVNESALLRAYTYMV
jgi:hypothetical protein